MIAAGLRLCEKRTSMLAEYDTALAIYMSFVDELIRRLDRSNAAKCHAAGEVVRAKRKEIFDHCSECGCDPDWVKFRRRSGAL